jgi:hypothetical protein
MELEILARKAKSIPRAELERFIKKYKPYEPEIGHTFTDSANQVWVKYTDEKCYQIQSMSRGDVSVCYTTVGNLVGPFVKIAPKG